MLTKPKKTAPKVTNCRYCDEPLPDSEIKMQSHAHEKCWKDEMRKAKEGKALGGCDE